MPSPICERAVSDARAVGRALLKFISPNDAGTTGAHQSGFYLPIGAWEMYTPHTPERGKNEKHKVEILWQDGRKTDSVVTWYGKAKSEYRLTRFGREFPFLNADAVGNLLILIPVDLSHFRAYVLDLEEDIDELQASLGVEVIDTWGVYEFGRDHIEDESECIDRRFREFAATVEDFPPGDRFAAVTREALIACVSEFTASPTDEQLMRAVEAEYALFRLVERHVCSPQIQRLFKSVDDFLTTAASIMNRRKSRAGRSFENHVEFILRDTGIPFEVRPNIDGRPDLIIPSAAAYKDQNYPTDHLLVVGLKTTCKDRWRQILNEGTRVPCKHLITMQRGISSNQLAEMVRAKVSLIVPAPLHAQYPGESPMAIKTLDDFVAYAQHVVAA